MGGLNCKMFFDYVRFALKGAHWRKLLCSLPILNLLHFFVPAGFNGPKGNYTDNYTNEVRCKYIWEYFFLGCCGGRQEPTGICVIFF